MGSRAPPAHGARPGTRPDRPARPAGDDQADGRAPHGGLGLGRDAGAALAADGRAGPRAHLVLALGARRVRPAAGGRGAGRAGPLARPRRGVPLPAHRRAPGPGHRPCARRLLHRRLGAWLQRLDVHGPHRDLDPIGHRLGGRGRDRHAQGPAPRRRPVGGRRPAQPDRVGRRCRGMGPRDACARRSADGLRPSGLSGLRPAGRGPAQGRRGDAQPAGLAPAGDRRRGRRRCASSPRSTRSGRSRRTSSTTRRPSSWASA